PPRTTPWSAARAPARAALDARPASALPLENGCGSRRRRSAAPREKPTSHPPKAPLHATRRTARVQAHGTTGSVGVTLKARPAASIDKPEVDTSPSSDYSAAPGDPCPESAPPSFRRG